MNVKNLNTPDLTDYSTTILVTVSAHPHAVNMRNLPPRKRNRSGICGVFRTQKSPLWRAQISVSGKPVFLGAFACLGQAVAARRAAEKRHGFHKHHGKRINA